MGSLLKKSQYIVSFCAAQTKFPLGRELRVGIEGIHLPFALGDACRTKSSSRQDSNADPDDDLNNDG